jgi:hypothetical protein
LTLGSVGPTLDRVGQRVLVHEPEGDKLHAGGAPLTVLHESH